MRKWSNFSTKINVVSSIKSGYTLRAPYAQGIVSIMSILAPTITELKQGNLPVIVADHEGNIVDINLHFERVFGWTVTEIVGQPLTVILPAVFQDSHNLGFARFSATGQSKVLNHPLNLKAVTKDQQEIESEHFIVAEKQGAHWLFAASLRPLETT
jgi:PAS domain-containing protein